MNQAIILFISGQAITLIGAGFTIYTRIMVKLKELELRVKMVEKLDDSIVKKLDGLQSSINDVKISLENKLDRD